MTVHTLRRDKRTTIHALRAREVLSMTPAPRALSLKPRDAMNDEALRLPPEEWRSAAPKGGSVDYRFKTTPELKRHLADLVEWFPERYRAPNDALRDQLFRAIAQTARERGDMKKVGQITQTIAIETYKNTKASIEAAIADLKTIVADCVASGMRPRAEQIVTEQIKIFTEYHDQEWGQEGLKRIERMIRPMLDNTTGAVRAWPKLAPETKGGD